MVRDLRLATVITLVLSMTGCVTSLVCSGEEMEKMRVSGIFSTTEIKNHCVRSTVNSEAIRDALDNIKKSADTINKVTDAVDKTKDVLDKLSGSNN